jgi:hypothetical protein
VLGAAQYPLGPIAIKPIAKGFTEQKHLLPLFFLITPGRYPLGINHITIRKK